MLFGCNGAATAADEVELENKMVIFLREVRGWHSPFLRLTDDRNRCFKRKRDLILRWRCNTKLVLTMTTLYRDPRGKMGQEKWLGTSAWNNNSCGDPTRSLQCQRPLIVTGDGVAPSRHLLNYP